jgi:hypothetical protein
MEHVAHDARSSRQPRSLSSSRSCGAGGALDDVDPNGTVVIKSIYCEPVGLPWEIRKWQDGLCSSHIGLAPFNASLVSRNIHREMADSAPRLESKCSLRAF